MNIRGPQDTHSPVDQTWQFEWNNHRSRDFPESHVPFLITRAFFKLGQLSFVMETSIDMTNKHRWGALYRCQATCRVYLSRREVQTTISCQGMPWEYCQQLNISCLLCFKPPFWIILLGLAKGLWVFYLQAWLLSVEVVCSYACAANLSLLSMLHPRRT